MERALIWIIKTTSSVIQTYHSPRMQPAIILTNKKKKLFFRSKISHQPLFSLRWRLRRSSSLASCFLNVMILHLKQNSPACQQSKPCRSEGTWGGLDMIQKATEWQFLRGRKRNWDISNLLWGSVYRKSFGKRCFLGHRDAMALLPRTSSFRSKKRSWLGLHGICEFYRRKHQVAPHDFKKCAEALTFSPCDVEKARPSSPGPTSIESPQPNLGGGGILQNKHESEQQSDLRNFRQIEFEFERNDKGRKDERQKERKRKTLR